MAALTKVIKCNRRLANQFHRASKRKHLRAAALAKRALEAKQEGHDVKAQNLMRRALLLKAKAARAGIRSKIHRKRLATLTARAKRQAKRG